MLVVKSHKTLNGEKADAKMLAMRNNVTAKDTRVSVGTRRITSFQILNYSIIDYVAGFLNTLEIETLRSTENDICQNVNRIKEQIVTSLVPRSRTEISGTLLVTGFVSILCLPRVMTAFWYD